MAWSYNPFTNKLDKTYPGYTDAEIDALLALYLKLTTSNDPLTGELVITPASGTNALKANKDITIAAGRKLIFDGA